MLRDWGWTRHREKRGGELQKKEGVSLSFTYMITAAPSAKGKMS